MMRTTDQLSLERLVGRAVDSNATDLHLSAGNPPRARVDGKLVSWEDESVVSSDLLEMLREAWLEPDEVEALSKEKEITVVKTVKDKIRFRVHVYYQQHFLTFSLHFLPNSIKTLDQLGVPTALKRLASLREGLLLIAGPFGSGRTTTLLSLLSTMNQSDALRIVTFERPIEVFIPDDRSLIDQREIGKDVIHLAEGLRGVLTEDVDVVAVSEVFEAGEMEAALAVADSRRLLLTTFVGQSAVEAIERWLSHFSGDRRASMSRLLGQTLAGVVVQRQVPKIGGGRVIAYEMVLPTPMMRSHLVDGNLYQLRQTIQHSREEGILSMEQSLAQLVVDGVVRLEDALLIAPDRETFHARLALLSS